MSYIQHGDDSQPGPAARTQDGDEFSEGSQVIARVDGGQINGEVVAISLPEVTVREVGTDQVYEVDVSDIYTRK